MKPAVNSMNNQENILSDQHLISSIGKKVLYCNACLTADFGGEEINATDDGHGKAVKLCPYCADPLIMRSEDRIKNLLQSPESETAWINKHSQELSGVPHSTVTRYFNTPYGRVKMHISVHSWFAPVVTLNDVLSPAIKLLVDEQLSEEAMRKAWGLLGLRLFDFATTCNIISSVVDSVHNDPNAVEALDFDLAQGEVKTA